MTRLEGAWPRGGHARASAPKMERGQHHGSKNGEGTASCSKNGEGGSIMAARRTPNKTKSSQKEIVIKTGQWAVQTRSTRGQTRQIPARQNRSTPSGPPVRRRHHHSPTHLPCSLYLVSTTSNKYRKYTVVYYESNTVL